LGEGTTRKKGTKKKKKEGKLLQNNLEKVIEDIVLLKD